MEDFFKFCGLLRISELYKAKSTKVWDSDNNWHTNKTLIVKQGVKICLFSIYESFEPKFLIQLKINFKLLAAIFKMHPLGWLEYNTIGSMSLWSHFCITVWPEPIWIKVKSSRLLLPQHQSTYLRGPESTLIEILLFRPHFIKFSKTVFYFNTLLKSKSCFTMFTFRGTFTK